jgi:antitoxin YqcF
MISALEKAIATQTASAFEVVKPRISQMWDDAHERNTFVLEAPDRPQSGVTSYATVGLSAYPLTRDGVELPVRAEVLGACGSAFPEFERVLASIAFCVINSKWSCAPGTIFPGVLDLYKLSLTMSDVYFAYPFLWGDVAFKSREIDGLTVAWLQAVPISKDETEFARRFGPQALEELFARKDIDTYNLNRLSVV